MALAKSIFSFAVFLLIAPAIADESKPAAARLLRQEEVTIPVDQEALLRQYAALAGMPFVSVTYTPRGTVRLVTGDLGISLADIVDRLELDQPAPMILQEFRDLLLADGDESLVVRYVDGPQTPGLRLLRFDEYIGGIPVIHGGLAINVRSDTGAIEGLAADFLPDRGLPREPLVSADEALVLALKCVRGSGIARSGTVKASGTPSLAYFGALPDSTRGQLVWVVKITYQSADSGDHFYGDAWIDAIDGSYVGQEPLSASALSRTPYSANGTMADKEHY